MALSQLKINIDKDWLALGITNVKELAPGMARGDILFFDATVDPVGLWIVNGTIGIHEVLRVTLQSNAVADDGQPVDYDYLFEAM